MRNLKKVLALALAVVMLVGMMVVGASAAGYADVAGSDYGTAISVVSAIKALEGSNGNFRPDGRLTRADAAVIAARVALQRDNANKLAAVTAAYTDVSAKAYYAGAIAWATNEGILAGNGDGTFRPNGSLTGYAFAKMMLGVLGYDAEIEGYVNDKDYLVNINYDAAKAGLLAGLEDLDLSAKMTRGQAAQMAFNALKAPIVDGYATSVIPVNGEWTVVYKANETNDTLAADVYGLVEATVESAANEPSYKVWTLNNQPVATEALLAYTEINAKTNLSKLDLIDGLQVNVNGNLTPLAVEITDLCVPGNTVKICVDVNEIVDVTVTSETLLTVVSVDYDEITELYTFELDTVVGEPLNDGTVDFDDTEDADNTLYNALVALDLEQDDVLLANVYAGEIAAVEVAVPVVGVASKLADKYAVVNGTAYTFRGDANVAGVTLVGDQALYVDSKGTVLYGEAITAPTTNVTNYIFVTGFTSTPKWENGQYVPSDFKAVGFDLNGAAVEVAVAAADENKIGTLNTYGTATYNSTTKTYTLTGLETVNGKINDYDLQNGGYFYSSDVAFLYVENGDTDNDNVSYEIVAKTTGVTATDTSNHYVILDRYNRVINVVVLGAPKAEEQKASKDLIYIATETLEDSFSYYTMAADGETLLAHYDVYILGEKVEIVQLALNNQDTSTKGWYGWTTDENGLTNLIPETYGIVDRNIIGKNTIEYVNGEYYIITDVFNANNNPAVGQGPAEVLNATDAIVVSMVPGVNISSIARLNTYTENAGYTNVQISLEYGYTSATKTYTVDTIYITGLTPAGE